MDRGIRIARIWSDDDMVELTIEVADGASRFVNRVYVGFDQLKHGATLRFSLTANAAEATWATSPSSAPSSPCAG